MNLGEKILTALAITASLAGVAGAQSQWEKSTINDPLHGTNYLQFKLKGSFLTPPQKGTSTFPELILHCMPGSYAHGKARGKLLDGYITVGTVLDSHPNRGSSLSRVSVVEDVELRLDSRKLQQQTWGVSTDRTAVFVSEPLCDFCALNNLMFGHDLPHKEGTGDQVHKVLIGIHEYLAAEVVMDFELPDVTDVADACGVILHK